MEEHKLLESEFRCKKCGKKITNKAIIGSKNRNHCPFCLYSLHLDNSIPGDRKANCRGLMRPIALCFKFAKINKYGNKNKYGELMLVHKCQNCKKISLNRLAGDDDSNEILKIFNQSKNILTKTIQELTKRGLKPAKGKADQAEINRQLFGIRKLI